MKEVKLVGLQLKAPIGEMIETAIWLDFLVSNNETEYEAILAIIDFAMSVSSEKSLYEVTFNW